MERSAPAAGPMGVRSKSLAALHASAQTIFNDKAEGSFEEVADASDFVNVPSEVASLLQLEAELNGPTKDCIVCGDTVLMADMPM